MSREALEAGIETAAGWAALRFAGITLLLPRGDVTGRIPLERIEPGSAAGAAPAGWGRFEGERVAVYRLDEELRPVSEPREQETDAVVVGAGERHAALACEQVRELEAPHAVDVKPLPACLANPDSPVKALGLFETLRVGLVVRGEDLLRHLETLADGRE